MSHAALKHRDYWLERRIANRLILMLCLVFAVLALVMDRLVTSVTEDFVLSRLQHDGESLISHLQSDDSAQAGDRLRFRIEPTSLPSVYNRAQSGHYFIISSGAQRLSSRSLWDLDLTPEQLPPGDTRVSTSQILNDQQWLVWQQGFEKSGVRYSLWIAEDIAPLQTELLRVQLALAGLFVLTVSFILLWQRRVLRQGFAVFQKLSQALEQQTQGAEPVPLQDLPVEVRPLIDAVQQRLARSGAQTERSRTALGNLAHELKRPLQQLLWYAERINEPEIRQGLNDTHQLLRKRIDRELRRARIAGSPVPGKQFNAAIELPLILRLMTTASGKTLQTELRVPDRALPFDSDDMIELCGNLIDNAWRYATRKIQVSLDETPDRYILRVEDDGPGVAPVDLDRLSLRGVRLDEQQDDGQGLGLSICRAVAESYQGEISFHRSGLGGLLVEVALPR